MFRRHGSVYEPVRRFTIPLLPITVASILAAQQNSSIIDLLTVVQMLDVRLRATGVADVTPELRSLHQDIAPWNAGHLNEKIDVPQLPATLTSASDVLSRLSVLKHAHQERERALPGGVFNAGRIEVDLTATTLQTPTAVTLLPKTANALNLLSGVTIQKVGPRNKRGIYVWGFDSNSTQGFFVQPNVFRLRNLGEARYLGTEFGIRTTLTKALQFWANCTYLSRRNQRMPSVIVVDTPRHKIYSSAVYSLDRGVTAFADSTYEGGPQ